MSHSPQRQTVPVPAPVWAIRGDDRAVADFVAAQIRVDRDCHLAVAGGVTPMPILELLGARDLAWHRVTVWPTDERLVHEANHNSNFGMINKALGRTPAWVCPLGRDVPLPRFNLVWLGMGEDGKIASLFPGQVDLGPQPAICPIRPDPMPAHAPFPRLTLNLPALVNADQIILVIRGAHKRRLLERAIAEESDLPFNQLLRLSANPIRIFWTQ